MIVLRLTVFVMAIVIAAACTSGAAPTAAPTMASPQPPSAPSASPTLTTPQEAALAAYEQYLAATLDAMSAGDTDAATLDAVADGQALRHARRRLRANRRDGVVVTGTLESSATVADVEVDGGQSSATVTDCVLNGLEQVAADDPDDLVSEATGWRQPVTATVELRDGAPIVTTFKVPLRDGSGSVPPPPDDPPYLRGPAQGPAPPSCVPPDLAQEAVAAYEAFRDAYDAALGLGRSGPADPDLAALADTAVDPQLSAARDFISSLAEQGRTFRGERDLLDPWAISARQSDQKVVIFDCVTVGSYGASDATASDPVKRNADSGTQRLDGADVLFADGLWKVSGVSVLEEGLEECTSPAR